MDTVVNPSGNFLDGGLLINLRQFDRPSMLIYLFVVAWFKLMFVNKIFKFFTRSYMYLTI